MTTEKINPLAERLEAEAHGMEARRFHSTASLLREAARAIREAESEAAVAWQVQGPNGVWQNIRADGVEYYRSRGVPVRPLYAGLAAFK